MESDAGASAKRGGSSGGDSAVLAQVEKNHIIGPAAARELDYRVAWQYSGGGSNIKLLVVEGDSAFLLDGQHFLTRIKIADGHHLWRTQVAEPIDVIVGLNFTGDRVYLTTSGAILVLDPNTGSQIAKHTVQQIANTQPVALGEFLIYGSRNGQVVWHSARVGYKWRGYQIANVISVPPVLADKYIVAVGSEGEVMVINAAMARQQWSKKLLAPVVAKPATGAGAVYLAGQDQYIWAFDLSSGRNLWKVLTESPLSDSPTLIGDRVYQQVPREGLHCFEALPPDTPGGRLIWKSPELRGNVVMQRRSDLFVWDAPAKRLTVAEARRGGVIKALDLPAAKHLRVGGEKGNEIYAASDDGRLVRLVPRN